ncbi:MAG: DUF2490 domain-containing protein [Pseudomonadota bacterium]
MMKTRIALGAACLLSAAPALAQQEDEQLWLQVNTNVPITDKVRITLEQIARWSDRQKGLYQTEFGGLIGVRVAKNVELGFGYRKVGAHNGNTGAPEDRLRQHIVATFGPVTTRLRVDERFHPDGPEIGFRIRPLIRYNYKLKPDGLGLFVSHESFYLPNSTRWGQREGYERMRNIVGVMVPVGKHVMADVGYLNQFRPARSGAVAQMDHALNIQFTINLQGLVAPDVHD